MKDGKAAHPAGWWHEYDFGAGMSLALDVREVVSQKTEYQTLQIFEHALLGKVLALDGIIQTTQADEFIYHEMMTHVALQGRATPARRVLIVGGGDGGMLREVLADERVEAAVMVEIDRAVVELTAEHLGFNGNYDDPRVELIFGDAFEFVRSDAARSRPFDVAIVDSTDPVGPGERLFTDRFLSDLSECLDDEGVMVRQAGIPFHQRDEMPDAMRQTERVFGTAELFRAAVPTYSGGDMAFVVGLKGGGTLREPQGERIGRYYTPDVHRAAFAIPPWWRTLRSSGAA